MKPSVPRIPDGAIPGFRRDLLAWYHTHRRRLPWREEPSLYRTVVSEFMLQQTQVKTMLPYFARWMAALPDFAALASATPEQVVKLWEGLGYYTRARNLHRLAQALETLPELPRTAAQWQELPGIGPYSSAAIASIAGGDPTACVDGNVVRILARLTGDETSYKDSVSAAKAFTPAADALLNPAAPGDHNQAMMELGATVCHRRAPLCTVCPVRTYCAAVRRGDPEMFPQLAPKPTESITRPRAWCVYSGKLLLHRAAAGAKRLAAMYELPELAQLGQPASLALDPAALLYTGKRSITKYRFTEPIYRVARPVEPLPSGMEWVPMAKLDKITTSGPHRRWISRLLAGA